MVTSTVKATISAGIESFDPPHGYCDKLPDIRMRGKLGKLIADIHAMGKRLRKQDRLQSSFGKGKNITNTRSSQLQDL
jgi:hypothetical protein